MISLKILSTAAILALALPVVASDEGFAQKGAGAAHYGGGGGGWRTVSDGW
jgi:hypothetical protein